VVAEARERAVVRSRWAATSALDVVQEADLAEFPARCWNAARSVVGRDAGDLDRLVNVLEEVASLEDWARSVRTLRPTVALTKEVVGISTECRCLVDLVLDALAATTVDEAQLLQVKLNRAMDALADRAGQIGEAAEVLDAILSAEDGVGTLLQLAVQGDFLSAEATGAELLEQMLGVQGGSSVSIQALVGDTMAAVLGDRDAFWTAAKAHLAVLRSTGAHGLALTQSSDFQRRFTEVAHDEMSATRRATRIPASTDREVITDLLEAGHLAIEQSLKLHLGHIATVTTKMSFATTQRADTSDLVGVAKAQGWPVESHLPASTVRNGFAHRSYYLEGDEVVFPGPKAATTAVRMDGLELQDNVLQAIEVTAAMGLALAVFVDEAGMALPAELPTVWVTESILVGMGWTSVSVQLDGHSAIVEAEVDNDGPITQFMLAAHPLTSVATHLDLRLRGPDRKVRIEAPLGELAAWDRIVDPDERSARFVALCRTVTRDGTALMTLAAATKVLAVSAVQHAADQDLSNAEVIRRVRILRAVSKELGLTDLARELGRLMRWRASVGTDMALDHHELQPIFRLMEIDVDPPIDMLFA
jgi:hypothetical protein